MAGGTKERELFKLQQVMGKNREVRDHLEREFEDLERARDIRTEATSFFMKRSGMPPVTLDFQEPSWLRYGPLEMEYSDASVRIRENGSPGEIVRGEGTSIDLSDLDSLFVIERKESFRPREDANEFRFGYTFAGRSGEDWTLEEGVVTSVPSRRKDYEIHDEWIPAFVTRDPEVGDGRSLSEVMEEEMSGYSTVEGYFTSEEGLHAMLNGPSLYTHE